MSGIQGAGNLTAQITPVQSLAAEISSPGGLAAAITVGTGAIDLESITRTYTPTEEQQTEVIYPGEDYDGIGEVDITVGAISSTYVGSDIPQLGSNDITFSGGTVSVPTGFFDDSVTKNMPTGTAGTPTATKGTVSNHSISVTPSVTNTSGYITGSTINGTPVSVSASELVSGTYSVTSSGTKDVTNYASASVPAGTEGTPTATKGTVSSHSISVTPSVTNVEGYIAGGTTTGTAVTVSANELVSGTYTVTGSGTVDVTNYESISVGAGSATPAATISSTGATLSTGTNTLTLSKSVSNTPQVSAGYISSGTSGSSSLSLTASVNTRSSSDLSVSGDTVTAPAGYYGSSASKAVASGTAGTPTATKGAVSNHSVSVTPSVTNTTGYITGSTKTGTAVTVSASELDSGTKSITSNGSSQDVVGYASVDVNVPNSYSAGDEGKVVSSGALVSQTAHADVTPTTSDQTIDTTTNNSIKVKGDADLVAGNIKKDVEIFGVTGSYEGGGGSLGGLANMADVNDAEYAFAFMLSQMKNGETVGGTVTYSGAFKNTEQLVLSTGLSTIHGFMFACPIYDMTTSLGTGQSNKFFMAMLHSYQETPAHYWVMGFSQSNASANAPNRVLETRYNATPENGSFRISGGDIYFTARYNKNANYQFVRPNVQYEWLAW